MVSLSPLDFPQIQAVCESDLAPGAQHGRFSEHVRETVLRMLAEPLHMSVEDDADREDLQAQFESQLPLLSTQHTGDRVVFRLVQPARKNAFKFFFEMVSHWLVPGTRLDVALFNAIDFRMLDLSQATYTLAEVVLRIESAEQFETIQRNLPIIETEICLGARSPYHARRILEVKGYSTDEKTATIQEHVANLLHRRPDKFDSSLLSEMQHVLVMCKDEFKAIRECRHLCRIIGIGHLFRQSLRDEAAKEEGRRHLQLKILHSRLHLQEGTKTVLGIIVGVNFLKDNESLEERHIIKAVQNYVPGVRAVEGSFLANSGRGESICTLYLEIEKGNGEDFTGVEIQRLRKALPSDLKDRIEHLMHPVFMPRNEEEIMRNMLTLGNQLRYLRDLPQVFISFDEQTDTRVSFCVIMARIIKKNTKEMSDMFQSTPSVLEYVHDSSRTVGHIRRKYSKEATVFHVRLPKHTFLRRDNSLDLYKARQVVVDELTRIVGEFRDYNGGMISKQNELLCNVRDLLGPALNHNEFLLENFFYSMNPVVMRTILQPELLKELFCLLLRSLEDGFFQGESYAMKTHRDEEAAYAVVTAEVPALRTAITRELEKMDLDSLELATTFVNVYDTPRLGYLLRSGDPKRQDQFLQALEQGVARFFGRPTLVCA